MRRPTPLTDEALDPEDAALTPRQRRRMSKRPRNTKLLIRRIILIAILLVIGGGIYYALFFTDLFAPVLAQVQPAQDFIDWVVADPSRLMAAAAVFILTHIGLYEFLTGRQL